MNLRSDDLANHLSRELKPAYIVFGDEPLQVDDCCSQIRAAAKAAGFEEREVYTAEAQFKWEQILEAGNALSLFSSKKLIELRIPSGKPGDAGSKAIQAFLANQNPDQILLVSCPRLDKSAQRGKWFKALDEAGASIAIWPLNTQQLQRWLQKQLQEAGFQAEHDALALLTELTDGNLLAAKQEIDKLKLVASPGQAISAETIRDSVSNSARFNSFDLTDAALLGRADKSLSILEGLRGEGVQPIQVLWALTREVRQLLGMLCAIEQGASPQAAMQQARVFKNRQSLIGKALSRLSTKKAAALLKRCSYTDRLIKGVGQGEPWDEIRRVVLGLAR